MAMEKVNVLLTGVTGFVGRYLLYQLCESEYINEIYVLIRPKRGITPKQRFDEVLTDALFDAAREQGVRFDNIHVVSGDVKQPKLGMSPETIQMLSEKLTLVIHNAAALSFAATLQKSMESNTTCTWELYNMCKNAFKHKPSFVLISTIATNSHLEEVPERVTPFSAPAKVIYDYVKSIPAERAEEAHDFLKEGRLDGYGWSKGVVERMILEDMEENGGELPVYFVRPGGIISANAGPLPGWIHNTCFYAQLTYFIYQGKLPCFLADKSVDINMAPVDLIGNLTMCCVLESFEKRQRGDFSLQVVNGSKPLIEGITFTTIFEVARANFHEMRDQCQAANPELEYRNTMPREPFYFKSKWIADILYAIFITFPLSIYVLWMGSESKQAKKYLGLSEYIYKYVSVLYPYLTRNIMVENVYCEILESKYGERYPIDGDSIDRSQFVKKFLIGVGMHMVPFMEKKTQRILAGKTSITQGKADPTKQRA